MKKSVLRLTVIAIVLSLLLVPISVSAASNPYKDVTKKSVGTANLNAISYVKAHKGYSGIIKGKKFSPNKKITKREFIAVLANLYGKKNIPVNIGDVLGANQKVTPKWACNKLSATASRLGEMKVTWSKLPKGTLSRADAARYIKVFVGIDKRLVPKK